MRRKTKEEFIEKALKIHSDKYDYSEVEYINNSTKVKLILKETNEVFYQTPNKHLSGKSPEKRINILMTKEEFVEKSKLKHNNFYNYDLVEYNGCYEQIDIICPIHGQFKQIANSHLYGRGCNKCGRNNTISKQKMSLNDFIEKSNVIHYHRYDYTKVKLINQLSKVTIICREHGEFNQLASKHIRGQGCPKCKSSSGEYIISKILEEKNINYIKEYSFDDCLNKKKLRFDFYIPSINTCIEYDGIQHYEPRELFGGLNEFIKTKQRDNIKNKYCYDNNIKLLRISYRDDISQKINNLYG